MVEMLAPQTSKFIFMQFLKSIISSSVLVEFKTTAYILWYPVSLKLGFCGQKSMREMGWMRVQMPFLIFCQIFAIFDADHLTHSTLKNNQKWQKIRKKLTCSRPIITQGAHFQNPNPDFWKPDSITITYIWE